MAVGTLVLGPLLTAPTAGAAAVGPQSADYSTLPVDPNTITDSLAYTAAPLDMNPNGQPGVMAEYTHREGGTRQITTTILVLPDAQAATAALQGAAAELANQQSQPSAVGTGGTIVTGASPDGTESAAVLTFTEGNTATTIEFDGPPNDPVPHRHGDRTGAEAGRGHPELADPVAHPPQGRVTSCGSRLRVPACVRGGSG